MTTNTAFATFAKTVVQKFLLPALGRATLSAIAVGVIFFIGGVIVYNFGTGLPFQQTNVLFRGVILILTLALYTAAGVLVGLILGAVSSINRKLSDAEAAVHQIMAPVIGSVVERIPAAESGISIEDFTNLVDTKFAGFATEPSRSAGLFSIVGILSRLVLRNVLPIIRRLLLVNLVEDLRARGESHVTGSSVERFAREKMVRLGINFIKIKLYAVRKVTMAIFLISLLIPAVLVGFRLIS